MKTRNTNMLCCHKIQLIQYSVNFRIKIEVVLVLLRKKLQIIYEIGLRNRKSSEI